MIAGGGQATKASNVRYTNMIKRTTTVAAQLLPGTAKMASETFASYGCCVTGCGFYFNERTVPRAGFCHPGHLATHYCLAHAWEGGSASKPVAEYVAIAKFLTGRDASRQKTIHRLPQSIRVPVTKHARTVTRDDYPKVSAHVWRLLGVAELHVCFMVLMSCVLPCVFF